MVVIEVGANNGNDTARWLDDDNVVVYAFEPTPEMYLHLKNRFVGFENYFPMPVAVDTTDGWQWFNIASGGGWGCSSLHEFNPKIHELWEGRPDFKVTERIRVPTMRLDTFMNTFKIEKVDFLWIDAQGNDLRVLESLGDRFRDIDAGMVEVAYEVNLYDGVDNSHSSVGKWLDDNGFGYDLTPHNHKKEADITFWKK